MEAAPQKRARSYVWEHFDLLRSGKVKCLICIQELAYSNNTSSMLRHLRSKHPDTSPNPVGAGTSASASAGAPTRQGMLTHLLFKTGKHISTLIILKRLLNCQSA